MPALQVPPGVEGISALAELPESSWESRWTRIVAPEGVKNRLLNFALFSLRHRGRIDAVGLPLHGLVVLAGPPGTGKTTLAGGLADRAAREMGETILFVEVNAHAFPSQLLGESQRSLARLFERTVPDLAARGRPTIVLLDEVESLAVSRAGASLDTNPVDVHRATDAVLAGIDHVARVSTNVTFIATTNHEAGVDVAFLSRADAVEQMGLPGAAAIEQILRDTVRELAGADGFDARGLATLAKSCADASLDARQVRKLVLRAVTSRRELADDPSRIPGDDVAGGPRFGRRRWVSAA